jgi:hypothetical protein
VVVVVVVVVLVVAAAVVVLAEASAACGPLSTSLPRCFHFASSIGVRPHLHG